MGLMHKIVHRRRNGAHYCRSPIDNATKIFSGTSLHLAPNAANGFGGMVLFWLIWPVLPRRFSFGDCVALIVIVSTGCDRNHIGNVSNLPSPPLNRPLSSENRQACGDRTCPGLVSDSGGIDSGR